MPKHCGVFGELSLLPLVGGEFTSTTAVIRVQDYSVCMNICESQRSRVIFSSASGVPHFRNSFRSAVSLFLLLGLALGLVIVALQVLEEAEGGGKGIVAGLPHRRVLLRKCGPFGIPSTSHWTGAAIIVQ